jgi:hypothetical protein
MKALTALTVLEALYVKKHGDDFDIIVENFLPSRYESQPTSIIEAAACGKAVIVRISHNR